MDCRWGTGAWLGSRLGGLSGILASSLASDATTSSVAAILKFVFLEAWLLVYCMEAMLRDLDRVLGLLPITVYLTLACIFLGISFLVGTYLLHGFRILAVLPSAGSLT